MLRRNETLGWLCILFEDLWPKKRYFSEHGFDVVACPWRKADIALEQLKRIQALRSEAGPKIGVHAIGMVQTGWSSFANLVNAYVEAQPESAANKKDSAEAVMCF